MRRMLHGGRIALACWLVLGFVGGSRAAELEVEELVPPPSKELLSFDRALDRIVERSTGVAIQEATSGATRARNLPIRLAWLPSLGFEARQTTTGYGDRSDASVTRRQAEAVSQVNLFRFGSDYANLRAARSDEETQRLLVEDAILRAEQAAVAAMVAQIQRRQEIAISASIAKLQRDLLGIARQRYTAGLLPLQEADKLAVDLNNAESSLADAEIRAAEASAVLANLLGHDRISLDWPWKERLAASPARKPSPAELGDSRALAELLSRRPDWRAAEARVEAEDQRVAREWRRLLPSLDGALSYGFYDSPVGGPAGTAWTGTLSVSLPFFDRLTTYSQARAQAYARGAAEQSLEQVRRDARQEWESASRVFRVAQAAAVEREKTLAISRRIHQDNLKRFRGGRVSASDLAVDQSRVAQSELFAVQGWSAAHLAYARLCRAQGTRLKDCR